MIRRPLPIVLALASLLACASPARALLCSVNVSDMAFSTVDLLPGTAIDGSASVSISCTGVSLTTTRVCLNLNSGSGGADSSGRYMSDGAGGTLRYQLYQNAGRTVVWGSTLWGLSGGPVQIDVPLSLGGSGNASTTIYGRIFGGQASALAGTYTSNFSGLQLSFPYQVIALFDCSSILSAAPLFAISSFSVSATVDGNCQVAAQNINFGNQGSLSTALDGSGEVSVTCTPGRAYNIGLDNGQNSSTPGGRRMRKALETIGYGLYRDAGRSQIWGSTNGVDTVSGVGNGTAQHHSVYARVSSQTTPSAGTYTDVITVIVTY